MRLITGKIREIDYEKRLFTLLVDNRIEYFYLSRSQMKKYEAYLKPDLFVSFKAYDTSVKRCFVMAYDVLQFLRLEKHVGGKITSYYDINEIKIGVINVLKKDTYRMFLDLEFTMPPYSYASGNGFHAEIIEYGLIIEDNLGNVVDSASGFLRPNNEIGISDRTCEFLHVSPEKLRHGDYFSKFYNILKDYMMMYQPTIYVWGKNDYLMLAKSYELNNLKPITQRKDFVNLMQIIKNYYSIKNDVGLYKAYELFGKLPPMEVQDHNALHDASCTLEVYHHFLKEIE